MKVLFAVVTLAASLSSYADTIALIGAPLRIEVSGKACTEYLDTSDSTSGSQEVCTDRAFLMHYRVEASVLGEVRTPIIDFIGFYHNWGFPPYSGFEPAFIVLTRVKDQYHLEYISEVKKKAGRWWVCEEWSEGDSPECIQGRYAEDIAREHASAT